MTPRLTGRTTGRTGSRRTSRRLTPVRVVVVTGVAAVVAAVPAVQSLAGTRASALPAGSRAAAAPAARTALAAPVTTGDARAVPAAPAAAGGAGRVIAGHYIVVLKGEMPAAAPGAVASPAALVARSVARARAQGVRADARFAHAVAGWTASMTTRQVAQVRQDPSVAYVEPDRMLAIDATERDPDHGLDRLDQVALPLDHAYTSSLTGRGVTAYVVDTGIRATHADLRGRVLRGFSSVGDKHGTEDCNGHGTHVAGTIGGTVFGVAKQVRLVPVRVLACDGSGSTSQVIKGIDWVTAHAHRPAVANLSLGGPASRALDAAVQRAISAGVTFTVAAGNSARNACSTSPARLPAAITVGASTARDARSSFSNTGACLDLFAPGSVIRSDFGSSDTATAVLSGTSMASPHAAGVAALFLQSRPSSSPSVVAAALVKAAVPGVLTGTGKGSPNRLLHLTSPAPAARAAAAPPTKTPMTATGPTAAATQAAPTAGSPSSTPAALSQAGLSVQEQAVLDLVNARRAEAGCRPLVADATLTAVARAHSADMVARGFFSHTNPDGVGPFDRMRAAGYDGRLMGENIAAGYPTAAAVMDAWMNSTGHRANILTCGYTQIGVGEALGGPYGSTWTQDFGTP